MPVRSALTLKPAKLDPKAAGNITIELTLAFLTPMMGGGVEINGPQKPCDPVTPIRVASIRGQLRFWWRACNPANATTLTDLQKHEAALWGSTSRPSAVTITVVRQPRPPRSIEADRSIGYGAFPLNPQQGSAPAGKLHDFGDSTFVLTVRCPHAQREALEETIAAWTSFGGLGGRTRRGFGALDDRAQRTTPADLLHKLRDRPALVGVPSLARAEWRFTKHSLSDPRDAWSSALFALQDFRQGEGTARPPRAREARRPGRSRWPEPDEIRRLFRQHATGHEPVHRVRKFPRAAFGLPMIFHFSTRGDPEQKSITLKPIDRNRLASPLILRPIREGDHYRALALVLQIAGPPLELELDVRGVWKPVLMQLSPAEAQFKPLDGEPSPLTAFLRHFTATTKP